MANGETYEMKTSAAITGVSDSARRLRRHPERFDRGSSAGYVWIPSYNMREGLRIGGWGKKRRGMNHEAMHDPESRS